jgi:hypothetical protein
MGVIVPLKVERVALENAASVSGLLLTTDAVISEIKEEEEERRRSGRYARWHGNVSIPGTGRRLACLTRSLFGRKPSSGGHCPPRL